MSFRTLQSRELQLRTGTKSFVISYTLQDENLKILIVSSLRWRLSDAFLYCMSNRE